MRFDVLTLFPQWFDWMRESRPVRNALEGGELDLELHSLRDYSPFRHAQVDDTPYGGGPGMVVRVDVVVAALEQIFEASLEQVRHKRRIVVLSPAGRQFDDAMAGAWAQADEQIVLLCGRYEGFDHRVHEHVATEEVSIGPYVLSGGEPAAMAMIDAVARRLPGALGNEESLIHESFSDQLDGGSEYPHYTRPEQFRGWTVPPVLLGGNHAEIDRWRLEAARKRTADG